MSYFPMMVNMEGVRILVVGGGEEGRKKVEILSSFGARITLIAKNAADEAVELADRFLERGFEDQDLEGEFGLVVVATDDRILNERIYKLASRRKIPVNVVDDTELCTFIFPAIIKEKDVVCAVSSGGKSPYIAQYIKTLIRKVLPAGIGEINDKMGEYRIAVKKEMNDPAARREYLRQKLEELTGSIRQEEQEP